MFFKFIVLLEDLYVAIPTFRIIIGELGAKFLEKASLKSKRLFGVDYSSGPFSTALRSGSTFWLVHGASSFPPPDWWPEARSMSSFAGSRAFIRYTRRLAGSTTRIADGLGPSEGVHSR